MSSSAASACKLCRPGDDEGNEYKVYDLEDIVLHFDSGRAYIFPAIIAHYIGDHGWNPGANFIADIMIHRVVSPSLTQKGTQPRKLGYIKQNAQMQLGGVPEACVHRVAAYVKEALAASRGEAKPKPVAEEVA